MQIISLNKDIEKYGFLPELEYKNEHFHGHQTALCIGIKNSDGSWDKTFTSFISGNTEKEKNEIADNILNDKSLIILEDNVNQLEDNKIVTKTFYYLPYYVANHSAYQPTVNFGQISSACNVTNDVKIEVLFVSEDGWYNRYVTFDMHTTSANGGSCMMLIDFIDDLRIEIEERAKSSKDFFILDDEDAEGYREYEYEEGDIALDFYDKSGQMHVIAYQNTNSFLDLISSVRIIDIDTKIVKE